MLLLRHDLLSVAVIFRPAPSVSAPTMALAQDSRLAEVNVTKFLRQPVDSVNRDGPQDGENGGKVDGEDDHEDDGEDDGDDDGEGDGEDDGEDDRELG